MFLRNAQEHKLLGKKTLKNPNKHFLSISECELDVTQSIFFFLSK